MPRASPTADCPAAPLWLQGGVRRHRRVRGPRGTGVRVGAGDAGVRGRGHARGRRRPAAPRGRPPPQVGAPTAPKAGHLRLPLEILLPLLCASSPLACLPAASILCPPFQPRDGRLRLLQAAPLRVRGGGRRREPELLPGQRRRLLQGLQGQSQVCPFLSCALFKKELIFLAPERRPAMACLAFVPLSALSLSPFSS